VGLYKLFPVDERSEDLSEWLNRNAIVRQPVLTQACRTELMEASCPVTAREVSEQIQERIMPKLPRPKNLGTAVTTILNLVVRYGEARTIVRDDGVRAWMWVTDAGFG
jgi:hypothetical protein